ncbi:MAG: YtxH domain-containing protein [Chloroflexaceae bacterium]|nr:YtxH domain-containing protein [Chloroflexaceae bacterium]
MSMTIGFVIGSLVGSVIGALITLMVAPRSVADKRSQIYGDVNAEVDRMRHELTNRIQELSTSIDQSRNDLSKQVADFIRTKEGDAA